MNRTFNIQRPDEESRTGEILLLLLPRSGTNHLILGARNQGCPIRTLSQTGHGICRIQGQMTYPYANIHNSVCTQANVQFVNQALLPSETEASGALAPWLSRNSQRVIRSCTVEAPYTLSHCETVIRVFRPPPVGLYLYHTWWSNQLFIL